MGLARRDPSYARDSDLFSVPLFLCHPQEKVFAVFGALLVANPLPTTPFWNLWFPDLFSRGFREGISFPKFVERSIPKLSLSKLCAVPLALQNRAFLEGRKGRKRCRDKGRKRGDQQRGQKGKKDAWKQVSFLQKKRVIRGVKFDTTHPWKYPSRGGGRIRGGGVTKFLSRGGGLQNRIRLVCRLHLACQKIKISPVLQSKMAQKKGLKIVPKMHFSFSLNLLLFFWKGQNVLF